MSASRDRARRGLPATLLAAQLSALAACGGASAPATEAAPVVVCQLDGRSEQRPLRDCSVVRDDLSLDRQETDARLDALAIDAPERARAKQALSSVADARRRLCDDWNACSVDRSVYVTRDETLATRRAEFGRHLADATAGRSAALIAWSRSVLEGNAPSSPAELDARDAAAAERIADAREQQAQAVEVAQASAAQQVADAQQQSAAAMAAANAHLGEVMAQAELRIRAIDEVLAILTAVRAGTVDAPVPSAPPICANRADLERMQIIAVSGADLVWDGPAVARTVEDLCARIERWRIPDERSRPAIARYVQRLARIEGWMREIRACVGSTGRDAARCENAYGRTQDAEAAEARTVEALIAAHRAELDGVGNGARPFPCTTPTLARIETMTFVGSVARAQMRSLPRDAEHVCDTIGVSESELRGALRNVRARLDQTESSLRGQRRTQQNSIESSRAQLGE